MEIFDYFFNIPRYNSKGYQYSWSDYFTESDFSYFSDENVLGNYIIGLLLSTFFFLLPFLILKQIIKTDSYIVKLLKFIAKRKKNITLSIISIPLLKVLIHYFFYPERISSFKSGTSRTKDFGYHINLIFEEHLLLFIPAFFLVLFFAWFFNDKIKAR